MKRIHYILGKISKRYRRWYWLRNGYAYLWGITRFIKDGFEKPKSYVSDLKFDDRPIDEDVLSAFNQDNLNNLINQLGRAKNETI